MTRHPCDDEDIILADFEWGFTQGSYVERDDGTHLEGQMYFERYVPPDKAQPWPVVMWHGGVQTGSNFTGTPDGRRGWLHDFLRAGFEVYVLDQPERGRSGHTLAGTDGQTQPMLRYDAQRIEQRFTGLSTWRQWPQAARHSRWPGSGLRGDPAFDRFFASQVQMLANRDDIERLNRDAGIALMDSLGSAILLTHSQSGPFGWLVADARPDAVKAILAIEPNGPPFRDVEFRGDPNGFTYADEEARPWGITRMPLHYEPDAVSAADLKPVLDETLAGSELAAGYMQSGPARQLTRLAGVPILIVTTEASYHAVYDHCTSAYLRQAGVEHDFVQLAERGITGNGHMVMLEQNNHEIAELLIDWLAEQVGDGK